MYNFDPYNVLLSIATNKPVLRMTASVLQGHICEALYSLHQARKDKRETSFYIDHELCPAATLLCFGLVQMSFCSNTLCISRTDFSLLFWMIAALFLPCLSQVFS